MGILKRTIRRISLALRARLGPRFRVTGVVDGADEIPQRIPRSGAVLVVGTGAPKWLVFDCPCPEAHRVMLNLDTARTPRWRVETERPLSISPSIDAPSGSGRGRCHYFIRDGRVHWVKHRRR